MAYPHYLFLPALWTNYSFDQVYTSRYGDIAPNEQRYQQHKDAYRHKRDAFRSDPRALPELEAWRRRDNGNTYELLNHDGKAFVPASVVGLGIQGLQPWRRADTFFSEYHLHNPYYLILSESEHSYIIGNKASYDGRQYPLPPMAKRPEGQGYCHTLVIPKPRIYNVVDPLATRNDCSVLKELCEHFKNFWTSSGKIKRRLMLQRARRALDERDAELVSVPIRRPPEYTELVRKAVFADFERMQSDFLALNVEDFLFGFHVFPDNSIGHLHMHVFPHDSRFREHSTKTYDYKTVPLQAILDVEAEDASPANGVHVDKGVEASAHETVDLTRVASSNGEGSSNLDAASMLDTPSEREESEDPPIGAVQLNNGTSSPDTFISGFVPVNR